MEYKRTHIYCSSSVGNFKEKLLNKFNYQSWNYSKIFKPTLFFGMYHKHDYKRFIFHRGKRYVMWCGSDILNLNKWNRWIFKVFKAKHYCENSIEREKLSTNSIKAQIQQLYVGEIPQISYKHSDKPQIWLCMHYGREEEYGLDILIEIANKVPDITFHIYGIRGICTCKNIIFHGKISEEQLNKETQNYQCGLRLNEFDGFSEVIAKSILMGQYPISKIIYERIDTCYDTERLIELLKDLKNKKYPNIINRNYWFDTLKNFEL